MGCIQSVPGNKITPVNRKTSSLKHRRKDKSMIKNDNQAIQLHQLHIGFEQINLFVDEIDQKMPVLKGLPNIGNTCYMNSGLQCLFHTAILNKEMSTLKQEKQFIQEYKLVYEKLKTSSHPPLRLKHFIETYNPQFLGNYQNDASELISTVLNLIAQQSNTASPPQKWADIDTYYQQPDDDLCQKYIARDLSRSNSIVDNTITGRFKTIYRCNKCGKQMRLFEKFNIIYLPIDRNDFTLKGCIKEFSKPDKLDSWDCLSCGQDCEHTKHMEIFKTNKVLILCLKRFTSKRRKINIEVNIPFRLSLEQIIGKGHMYELYGMVNHYGRRLDSGHYTAFCFNQTEKQWYEYNDRTVSLISQAKLQQAQKLASILFYRLAEQPNLASTSQTQNQPSIIQID